MAEFSLLQLTFVLCAFLVVGGVKGISGMDLPTVAIATLSVLMPPLTAAAALLLLPSFVNNVWQLLAGNTLRPSL
jgi:hypothetical protein